MKRLKKLVIDRVDLVDKGANYDPDSGEGSHILLAKRAEVSEKRNMEKMGMTVDEIMEHQKAMQDWYDLRNGFSQSLESMMHDDEMDEKDRAGMMMKSVEQFAARAKDILARMRGKEVAKFEAAVEALKSASEIETILKRAEALPTIKEEEETMNEEIQKRLDEQAELIAKMQQQNDEMKKRADAAEAEAKAATASAAKADEIAKAERGKRELSEAIVRAEKRWPHLKGTPVEHGPILLAIEKREALSDEQAKSVLEMLDGADAMAQSAFVELGTSGDMPAEGSAWDEVQKRATKLVQDKAAASFQIAVDQVLQADPTLYRKYRTEEQ